MIEKEKRIQEALGLRKTSAELQKVIDNLRQEEVERLILRQQARDKEAQGREHLNNMYKTIIQSIHKASVEDYLKWLEGFFNGGGGSPLHCYDYPFERGNFYITHYPLELPALYGALAFKLIVPAGVDVRPIDIIQDFGHINIFWMDGFKTNGSIPIFSDTIFSDTDFKGNDK